MTEQERDKYKKFLLSELRKLQEQEVKKERVRAE
jgi:hypothetical protein